MGIMGVTVTFSAAPNSIVALPATNAGPPMSKQARTKPSGRGSASARLRASAEATTAENPLVTQLTKATSTESMAASIVGLMVVAADSGTSSKVDANDKNSVAATAALAELIAVRFADDD